MSATNGDLARAASTNTFWSVALPIDFNEKPPFSLEIRYWDTADFEGFTCPSLAAYSAHGERARARECRRRTVRRSRHTAEHVLWRLSVDAHDRKLRDSFPEFRLVLDADWVGIWEGPLTPIAQTYRVRLVYFRRRYFDGWSLANP